MVLTMIGFDDVNSHSVFCFVSSSENEGKLLLWWHKLLDMLLRQFRENGSMFLFTDQLNQFITVLHSLGEDRATSGLLGVIGLGKKSQLSCRYFYKSVCCAYVCMYECVCVCVYVCMYTCMYVCIYGWMDLFMYVCMYVCVHVCMYEYICIYG